MSNVTTRDALGLILLVMMGVGFVAAVYAGYRYLSPWFGYALFAVGLGSIVRSAVGVARRRSS